MPVFEYSICRSSAEHIFLKRQSTYCIESRGLDQTTAFISCATDIIQSLKPTPHSFLQPYAPDVLKDIESVRAIHTRRVEVSSLERSGKLHDKAVRSDDKSLRIQGRALSFTRYEININSHPPQSIAYVHFHIRLSDVFSLPHPHSRIKRSLAKQL